MKYCIVSSVGTIILLSSVKCYIVNSVRYRSLYNEQRKTRVLIGLEECVIGV